MEKYFQLRDYFRDVVLKAYVIWMIKSWQLEEEIKSTLEVLKANTLKIK